MLRLSRCATAAVVPPARSAENMRRLASVSLIVTLVALRLWTLLITIMLGLRCRTPCSACVNDSFVVWPTRIRRTLLTPVLIGLLMATTPMPRPWYLSIVVQSAADPFELAGLAISSTFRSCVRTLWNSRLLCGLKLTLVMSCSLKVAPRTWTMIVLLRTAGTIETWRLMPTLLSAVSVWLLRGMWRLVRPTLLTIPTWSMKVGSSVGRKWWTGIRLLLTWQSSLKALRLGWTRTLEVWCRTVWLTMLVTTPIIGRLADSCLVLSRRILSLMLLWVLRLSWWTTVLLLAWLHRAESFWPTRPGWVRTGMMWRWMTNLIARLVLMLSTRIVSSRFEVMTGSMLSCCDIGVGSRLCVTVLTLILLDLKIGSLRSRVCLTTAVSLGLLWCSVRVLVAETCLTLVVVLGDRLRVLPS